MSEFCKTKVYSSGLMTGYTCRKRAKFEHEGQWYCGIHNPARLKAAAAVRAAKNEHDREALNKAWRKQQEEREQMKCQAENYKFIMGLFTAGGDGDFEFSARVRVVDGVAQLITPCLTKGWTYTGEFNAEL